MKTIRILLAFTVVQITCTGLHAQDKDKEQPLDYLVTNQGDTLRGKFKSGFSSRGSFKVDKKVITVDSDDHMSYYLGKDKELYRTVAPSKPSKKYWCLVLEDGPIRLYEQEIKKHRSMMNPGTGSMLSSYTDVKRTWYATKNDSVIVEVKTNSIWGNRQDRKDAVSELFSDDPETLKEYEQAGDFRFDTVRALVARYNKRAKDKAKAAAAQN